MRKKLLIGKMIGVLAVVLMLFMAAGIAEEERTDAGGQWKYVLEDGGAMITGYEEEPSGDLVIPSELDGYPVMGIGDNAFLWCEGITSVTIPNSVTSISGNPFVGCSIIHFDVAADNPVYYQIDGVLFNKEYAMLISYPGTREDVYIIPEGTYRINDEAFMFCALTGVTIPDSVVWIADGAFANCESLTSITIPDSVTVIRPRVFRGCKGLSDIVIPDSVTHIGSEAFSRCIGLTSLTIPDSVTSISYWAFLECENLSSVNIPNSVTNIGKGAFSWCGFLTSLIIPPGVTDIDDSAFDGCHDITLIVTKGSFAEQYAKDNEIPYELATE